ncbi:MFS general substrate transporter [Aspergillus unguis]
MESDKEHNLSASSDEILPQNADTSPRTVHSIKWALAYASLISTVLFYSLDGTIVADIQPSILESLGGIDRLAWIGVAIALGTTAILPMGKAYGIFNIKYLFLSCVAGFEAGSAICGAAPNMDAMIIGRVIQGVAGCGCYSGALVYISLTTSKTEQPVYLSGVVAMWGLGSVLGPVIGGAFAQSAATWRWAFYINLVVAAVFSPALLFCLPDINPLDMSFGRKVREMDWIGIVVFLGGAACLTMAITFGGTTFSFSSAHEITLWTVSGVLLLAFILTTIYHPLVPSRNRLYPIHLMKNAEIAILQFLIFGACGAMMITLYYTPLIFQFTRGDGPLMAGVRLLPFVCLIVFLGVLNGVLMPRLGYYMPWYVFGNAAMLVGSACMMTINASTSVSKIYGYTALIGAGTGSYITAGYAVVQSLIPVKEHNDAVSFMAIGQMMGQIILLSVAGSLYQNISARKLSSILPRSYSASDIQQLTTGRHSPLFETLGGDVQGQVVEQVALAIRNTFAVVVAVSGRQKLY